MPATWRHHLAILSLLLGGASLAWAHLPVLVCDPPLVRKGEPVTLRFAWGHPYERTLLAPERPDRLLVHPPSGPPQDLTEALTAREEGGGRWWEARFLPDQRGDHLAVLAAAPQVHGDALLYDVVKLPFNVSGVQQGWDHALGLPVEIVPLTRPYGIPAGTGFRAQVLVDGRPAPGVLVEVERLSASPPDPNDLPPDAFITRVEKTGAAGELSVTLPEDGWWVLAASAPGGREERDGAQLQVERRASLWVRAGR